MIVEIGTSDYDTKAGKEHGIYIEPVKYYFDKLPDNCIKENVAIRNKEGVGHMYYLTDELIKKYNLVWYVRGCNRLNTMHFGVREWFPNTSIEELNNIVCKQEVQIVRIKTILDKHNVTNIDLLKIDAETFDIEILNDFLDTVSIFPLKIIFEVNGGTILSELNKVSKRLKSLGYELSLIGDEMVCILKPKKV